MSNWNPLLADLRGAGISVREMRLQEPDLEMSSPTS